MKYLCYDIRGIQSFIFKIPKLRYIIGGSALIDRFDRETMNEIKIDGCKRIYSAGGKGAFFCDDNSIENIKEKIIIEAQKIGIDIRFGINNDFCEASKTSDIIVPFVTGNESLGGEPCAASGLYPVKNTNDIHPIIKIRNEKSVKEWFDGRLLQNIDTDEIRCNVTGCKLKFFRDVSNADINVVNGKNADCDISDCNSGFNALGKRNRWAVICMDGNDMGKQFREKMKSKTDENEITEWISIMSMELDRCSKMAAKEGIIEVVNKWMEDNKNNSELFCKAELVLPIRPLIVGGDDIVILCHSLYASSFVKKAIDVFNCTSKEAEKEYGKKLWPASADGEGITISAGILYCSVTLPLHSAIAYAEELLNGAKKKGRESNHYPSPATIDWEQITETIISTPEARRKKEVFFFDDDIKETVVLTQRPYTKDKFMELENLAKLYSKIPRSILYKILPSMRKGYSDRLAFVAEIRKHQKQLFDDLCEYDNYFNKSRWQKENGKRSIDVLDAILLLEEENRMNNEVTNG